MRKLILLFIVIGLCLLSLRCRKVEVETLPPNVLFFIVKENGATLPDSINGRLKIYFFRNGQKAYDPGPDLDHQTFLFPGANKDINLYGSKVLYSPYMYPQLSSTYYLEFPNGDVDTITVAMNKTLEHDQALKDRCRCYLPYTRVTFNGREAPEYLEESTSSGKIIYLFEKP